MKYHLSLPDPIPHPRVPSLVALRQFTSSFPLYGEGTGLVLMNNLGSIQFTDAVSILFIAYPQKTCKLGLTISRFVAVGVGNEATYFGRVFSLLITQACAKFKAYAFGCFYD